MLNSVSSNRCAFLFEAGSVSPLCTSAKRLCVTFPLKAFLADETWRTFISWVSSVRRRWVALETRATVCSTVWEWQGMSHTSSFCRKASSSFAVRLRITGGTVTGSHFLFKVWKTSFFGGLFGPLNFWNLPDTCYCPLRHVLLFSQVRVTVLPGTCYCSPRYELLLSQVRITVVSGTC